MKRPLALNVEKLLLYEDNHLLVLNKPGGLLVQADRTGDPTLLEAAKAYLKEKYHKPGRVYLGLVHRLDRVTSGVIIFAKTSKAARRLSQAFREGQVQKYYLAVVEGGPPPEKTLEDYLAWDPVRRKAYLSPEGKKALLTWRLLKKGRKESLLLVEPGTGRKHQIRAQLAAHGFPIVGDLKYGSPRKIAAGRAILLHAWRIRLSHPTKKEILVFEAPLPPYWPGNFHPDEGKNSPNIFAHRANLS